MEFSDYWETTVTLIRVTGRKVLSMSSGQRKEEKETWWWNSEVQESVESERLIKDRDGNIITNEEGVLRGWKEYFEELLNE